MRPRLSATSDEPYNEAMEKVRPTSRRERVRGAVSAPSPDPTRNSMRMPKVSDSSLEDMVRRILRQSMPKTGFFGGPSSSGGNGLPPGSLIGQTIASNGSNGVWYYANSIPAEAFGASPGAAPAVNVAAIQAALNVGGFVTITTPGTYLINGTLYIGSDTTLRLGEGVLMYLVNGAMQPMLVNKNWQSNLITVSNGISDAAQSPALTGQRVATADCGSNVHGFKAGQYVLIKGDSSKLYLGVFKVYSVPSPTTFTFLISYKTSYGSSTGTVTAELADANVFVEGGIWDFNGANNQSSYSYLAMGMIFNKIGNSYVRDTRVLNTTKYALYVINSDTFVTKDFYSDSSSDGVHYHAFTMNGLVDGLYGQSADDFFAYTSSNAGYTQYDIPNGDMAAGGDCWGLTVRNIFCDRTTENAVAIHCAGALVVAGVLIDNVNIMTGLVRRHVVVDQTSDQATNPTAVQDITIRNLHGCGYENIVKLGGQNASVSDVMVIPKVDIQGIYPGKTLTFTNHAIMLDNANITNFTVDTRSDITFDISAQRYLINASDQYSGWTDLKVLNHTSRTSSSGNSHKIIGCASGSTPGKTTFQNVACYGTADFMTGSPAGTSIVILDNCYNDAYSFLRVNFTSNLYVNNCKSGNPGGVPPILVFGSGITVALSVNGLDAGGAANWLQVGTNVADTLNLSAYFANIHANGGNDPGISWTAVKATAGLFLRRSDASYIQDASLWDSIASGCIYRNNNVAFGTGVGVYVQGPAAATLIGP